MVIANAQVSGCRDNYLLVRLVMGMLLYHAAFPQCAREVGPTFRSNAQGGNGGGEFATKFPIVVGLSSEQSTRVSSYGDPSANEMRRKKTT